MVQRIGMQLLTTRDPRQLYDAAPHSGICKQHCPQRFRTQVRQPLQLATHRGGRNHRPCINPVPLVTQQLDLPDHRLNATAHAQHPGLVGSWPAPPLGQQPDLECLRTQLQQSLRQGCPIQQPAGEACWNAATRVAPLRVPAGRLKFLMFGRVQGDTVPVMSGRDYVMYPCSFSHNLSGVLRACARGSMLAA